MNLIIMIISYTDNSLVGISTENKIMKIMCQKFGHAASQALQIPALLIQPLEEARPLGCHLF